MKYPTPKKIGAIKYLSKEHMGIDTKEDLNKARKLDLNVWHKTKSFLKRAK